jgi:predicted Rossmann fold nucleotide-binding protein DprA/Smf involved in DNA uptake
MSGFSVLTEDGRAVLLLCSTLGGAEEAFTLTEWNQLAKQIAASPYQRPAALLGQAAHALAKTLGCELATAERVARLLERGGRVALELEALRARGLWVMTRADPSYPSRLRQTLRHQAPSVLFGAGDIALLARPGIAVVGSRNIDEAGTLFAQAIGGKCAAAGWPVVSGGARGTDSIAMNACVEAGGCAVGFLADSLERTIRQPEIRQLLLDERVVLLTPFAPTAGFSVGTAMARNKLIYGLTEFAVVVCSEYQKGGTWAGAAEALRAGWCPVFAREPGNRELLKAGAASLPESALATIEDLPSWLRQHAPIREQQPELLPNITAEKKSRYGSRQ